MKNRFLRYGFILVLFLSMQFLNAQTMYLVKASNPNIQYTGRINNDDPDNIIFSFSGVSIKAKFQGTAIDAIITELGAGGAATTNYFNVIIDDGTPTVLKLSSSQTIYQLARNLTDAEHTVELFKRTESAVGTVKFQGFQLEAGKIVLQPAPLSTRKIEFIGNSITCGYGNESSSNPPAGGFTSVNENNYKAWGAVTARNLGAQYSCIAYSGRGLFQNNSGTKTGVLPLIYDDVIADDASVHWDHSKYIPNVIVINLGTNDFSAEIGGYSVDSIAFTKAYIDFISKLRGYYPKAKIIGVVGVMMSDYYPSGGRHWSRIQNYVNAVKEYKNANGDYNVFYYKMDPQVAPYGEDWHPTAATDIEMAKGLTDFINTIATWDCTSTVNLGNDISTCGSTFPITLNSQNSSGNNITFSWYKNNTLIPNATNATCQITSSTGAAATYKVKRDSTGCTSEDEVIVSDVIPQPNLGNDLELCATSSVMLSAGISGAGLTYTWKKNNAIIAGATSSELAVTKGGTYQIVLSSSNCTSMLDEVVVASKLLNVIDDTICKAGQVSLSASSGIGTLEWFTSDINGSYVNTGNNYNPTISTSTTYYVRDMGGVTSSVGLAEQLGTNKWGLGIADYTVNMNQSKLIVLKACTLSKLAVYPYTAGVNVTIRVMKGTTVVASKIQAISATGKQFIQCDFDLQPGTYTLDAVGTDGSLIFQAEGSAYPYTLANIITYTSTETWNTTWAGLFYDLQIFVGDECVRTPVNAVIDSKNASCTTTDILSDIEPTDKFIVYPNPANHSLTVAVSTYFDNVQQPLFNDQNEIQITNALGQIVFSTDYRLLNSEFQIDILHFQSGVYIVKIGNQVQKLIIK